MGHLNQEGASLLCWAQGLCVAEEEEDAASGGAAVAEVAKSVSCGMMPSARPGFSPGLNDVHLYTSYHMTLLFAQQTGVSRLCATSP